MPIIAKTAASFFILLFFTRALGKKQMNQITYFDYITGITLGSIAASVSVEEHVSLKIGVTAFITWAGLAFLISFISLKSYRARNFLDGEPDVIIKRGELIQKAVKRTHLNMDDIAMLLREKGVFSISDVEYAILEPHGKLSVLLKDGMKPVTKNDMKLPPSPPRELPTDIVTDGRVIERNLEEIGRDSVWMDRELQKSGLRISSLGKIFYMATQEDGSVYICLKDEK